MRALFFLLAGIGFLALIAFSWRPSPADAPLPPPSLTLPSPSREPASTPHASLEQIRRLEACHAHPDCAVPRGATGEALAVAVAEHFTNFGADAELARRSVQSPEAMVQAVGLRMLSTLPPSGESLSALGNGLRGSSDPALLAGAMRELQRYLGTALEADAQRLVENFLSDDAPLSAAVVLPFINEHSYEEFRALLRQVDSSAEAARLLRVALRAYDERKKD